MLTSSSVCLTNYAFLAASDQLNQTGHEVSHFMVSILKVCMHNAHLISGVGIKWILKVWHDHDQCVITFSIMCVVSVIRLLILQGFAILLKQLIVFL